MTRYWLLATDPADYHWDTLFVKGKELWDGIKNAAGQRTLRQVHRGDRVVCYHGAPEREVYAVALVASDPYPDPHDRTRKRRVIDLKAVQRLPRAIPVKELKLNRLLRRMKFLAHPRQTISSLSEQEYNELMRLAGLAGPGMPH